MGKSRAQLDLEVEEILRQLRPLSRESKPASGSLGELAEYVSRTYKNRQKRLHQALLRYPALIVTDGRGRQTLLISSGEMSNPQEGSHRVTKLLRDGPEGHVTRRSIARLAQDLARDLAPERIEIADDDRVSAWVSTPEYVLGSERVMEMQRLNRRGS